MRLFSLTMISILMAFFVSSTASAIEFSVLSSPTVTVAPGQPFTIDIALDNASATNTFGVTGTITGLAAAGAVATGGQSAVSHFVLFCAPAPTNCLGGINTVDNIFYNPNDLSASGAYNPGDDSIAIVNVLGLAATAATGALDPGLDGGITVPSARDASITLVASVVGTHVLTVGGTFSDGVNVLPVQGTSTVTVNVVPEPGTALLMGLGLAGLAAAGRRTA